MGDFIVRKEDMSRVGTQEVLCVRLHLLSKVGNRLFEQKHSSRLSGEGNSGSRNYMPSVRTKLGRYFDKENGMIWERFKKIKYTGLFQEWDQNNSGFWSE